jgi:small nuclear ribonucleoprotein D3
VAVPKSVPLSLLHEAVGHPVIVELHTRETYHGMLRESEDSMNVTLDDVTVTEVDGRRRRLAHVVLRGSHISMLILPEVLKAAPLFKRVRQAKERFEAAQAAVQPPKKKAKPGAWVGGRRGWAEGGRKSGRAARGGGGIIADALARCAEAGAVSRSIYRAPGAL